MGYEALYPVFAVAYGTFGLFFGLYLWWRTQRRIERTSQAVSLQVKNAVADITGRVDTKLGELPSADDLQIDSAALSDALGPLISEHVYQAVNQVKAQETKALQAQLEELGIGGVVDEAKGLIAESLPPQMIQAQRILGMKVSKKYTAEHPIEAQALEMGKLYLMQMLQGQMGLQGAPARQEAVSGAGKGFGVR